MDSIKFSFLMAAYNAEKYISEAIESALNQTYPNFELLILDDESTDRTVEIAQSYNDDRIRVIRLPHFGTAGRVRAEGYKYVTGDYIQILDADDYVSPDLLERYVSLLKNQNADVILPLPYSDTDGTIREITETSKYLNSVMDGKTAFDRAIFWEIHGWFCAKKELLQTVGYNYEGNRIKTDELNGRKVLFYANSVAVTEGAYYYRTNENSVTRLKANFVRVVESLIDENLLLKFAIENSEETTRTKCSDLLIQNLFVFQRRYELFKDGMSHEEADKAGTILRNTYASEELRTQKYSRRTLYGFLYWVSFNNYDRYSRLVGRLTRIYEHIKR